MNSMNQNQFALCLVCKVSKIPFNNTVHVCEFCFKTWEMVKELRENGHPEVRAFWQGD